MSNEIREKVQDCYKRLESLLDPTTFEFQPGASEIWEEVESLQKRCHHHYVDGICEFCNKEEN